MKKAAFIVIMVTVLFVGDACDDASLLTETDEYKAPLKVGHVLVDSGGRPHETDVKLSKPPKPHPHRACDTCGVVYKRSRLKKIKVFRFSYWDYLGATTGSWRDNDTRIYINANRVKEDIEPKLKSLCPDCHESLWQSLQPEEPCEKDTVQHIEDDTYSLGNTDGIVPDRIGW